MRPLGIYNATLWYSMVNGTRKVIPKVDDADSFKSWVHTTNDELLSSILII